MISHHEYHSNAYLGMGEEVVEDGQSVLDY